MDLILLLLRILLAVLLYIFLAALLALLWRDLRRAAGERALELDVRMPRIHMLIGEYHYFANKDYQKALEELTVAEKGLPNNAEILEARGFILRRMGRWSEALDDHRRSFELNPRDSEAAMIVAWTLTPMRKYREAMEHCDQSIALQPDQSYGYFFKAELV